MNTAILRRWTYLAGILWSISAGASYAVIEAGAKAESPEKIKSENDIKAHREAVAKANDDFELAIKQSGKDSVQAHNAKDKLDQERRELEKSLYGHGQVTGPAIPPIPKSESPVNQMPSAPPARLIEF